MHNNRMFGSCTFCFVDAAPAGFTLRRLMSPPAPKSDHTSCDVAFGLRARVFLHPPDLQLVTTAKSGKALPCAPS